MRTDDNLFPTLEPATYAALKDSIEQFGVLVPVAKDQDGKLIDGFHRSEIAEELGVDFRVDVIKVESDEQRDEIAAALNLYRRHLDVAERQEQVVFLRSKGHSLRAIADAVGVNVATAHRDLATVADATVGTPDGKVLGKDGKRRDAKRPTVISANTQADGEKAQAVAEGFDLADGGVIDVKAAAHSSRLNPLMSSDTCEWATPQDLFDELHAEFGFDLDTCAGAENAKCERYFSEADDGLAQKWTGTCWMNPPYGDSIGLWVEKARLAAAAGAIVVCLVPARVDTAWWWDNCRYGEIRFLRGRLKFGGAKTSAPFPSAVVIFGRPQSVVWWER